MDRVAYKYKLYLLCILTVLLAVIALSLFFYKNKYNIKDILLSFLTSLTIICVLISPLGSLS